MLNLSMCADSRTDTKTNRNRQKEKKIIYIQIKCDWLLVTCHLSLIPTAKDPPTASSPTMLVQKEKKKIQNAGNYRYGNYNKFLRFANINDTIFDQKSPVHQEGVLQAWTERRTYRQRNGHCDL